MIDRLARALTELLIRQGIIDPEDAEAYIYGFDSLLASVCQVICLLALAALTGLWLGTTAFSLCFTLIKRQAGGFHLSSHLRCITAFTAAAAICTGAVAAARPLATPATLLAWLAAAVVLWRKAPRMDPYNPKSAAELPRCRRSVRVRLALLGAVGLGLLPVWPECSLAGGMGVGLAAVSLLIPNRREVEM